MPLPLLIVSFLWTAGLAVLEELFRPVYQGERAAKVGLSDITIPTAQAGRPLPTGWGTHKLAGGNVVWDGDLETRLVKRKAPPSGAFGSGPKHTWGPDLMFFLGMDMALCVGPIDELIDIQFEDRTANASTPIEVTAGHNGIVFGNSPPPWKRAYIPLGTYADNAVLGRAASDAMSAVESGTWKVLYGYHMLPGFTSKVQYSVEISGSATTLTVDVAGVYLAGRDAANALARAINESEGQQSGGARALFAADYDEGTGLFHVSFSALRAGVTGAFLRLVTDYSTTAWASYGFQLGADRYLAGTSGTWTSDKETRAANFSFAFGGIAGKLDIGNPDFTSMPLFGLSMALLGIGTGWFTDGSGATTMPICAIAARPSPNFLYITDLGDRFRAVINQPDLFGGIDAEGGVVGTIDVLKGALDQAPDAYLEAVMGKSLPGYHGVCRAVFRHTYLGKSPYLKAVSFIVRRCPNGLGLTSGHENISGDANPAAVIYEILTNDRWGLGLAADLVDSTSFLAVGGTLFTEGLGFSMVYDSQTAAGELISDVLRYIDGLLFADPASGKLKLRLARADYDPDTVLELTDDDIMTCKVQRPTLFATKNIVRVSYSSRAKNFNDDVEMAIDHANIQMRGGERDVEEVQYRGISNAIVAQKIASRILKVRAYPLAPIEIVANRKASHLRPGDVFALTWGPESFTHVLMRVTNVTPGTYGTEESQEDDEYVHLQCLEDIFAVGGTSLPAGTGTGWVDPSTLPQPFAGEKLVEAPYAISTTRKVMTLASPGAKDVDGYKVWSDPAGGNTYTQTADVTKLTPRVTLAQAIGSSADSMIVQGADGAVLLPTGNAGFAAGDNLLLVDGEWIAWRDLVANADGTFTISHLARGCIDSAPRDHAAGAEVWAVSQGYGFTAASAYGSDVTVAAKLLGYIGSDVMPIANAIRLAVTLAHRASRPYCPAAFSVNRQSYPDTIAGDLTLAWTPRDRTTTWSYANSGLTAARESGTHERVHIYGEDDTLIHTADGITGSSFVYTVTAEEADTGLSRASTRLRIVIETLDGSGNVSQDALEHVVRRGSDTGSDTDAANKVKTTSDDTTPDYLANKLSAGSNITLTTVDSGGGNKKVQVAASGSVAPAMGHVWLAPGVFEGDGADGAIGATDSYMGERNMQGTFDNYHVATFVVPDDFTSLTGIRMRTCNRGLSASTFVCRAGLRVIAAGDDTTNPPTFGSDATITPSTTQDVLTVTDLALPAVTVHAGDWVALVIHRKGASDTNNDAQSLLGVDFRYS